MRPIAITRFIRFLTLNILLASLTVWAQAKQGAAVVRAVTGAASYIDNNGMRQPLAVGTVINEGQTVTTGFDGSVTFFLAENGPGIALNPGSMLRFAKLTATASPLGTLIDTQLDLQRGQLYGTVEKLLPGSRYEVKTPTSVASVRGTVFYIDASTGDVTVTSGTVLVKVVIKTQTQQLTRTITVTAGQTLSFPKQFNNNKDFDSLAAGPTPSSLSQKNLDKLTQLGKLTRYTTGGSTAQITETFNDADQKKKEDHIKLNGPPTVTVVSP